jgi:hypothetical protein
VLIETGFVHTKARPHNGLQFLVDKRRLNRQVAKFISLTAEIAEIAGLFRF